MLKRTLFALLIVPLTLATLAQAQEQATLTLRSGERISAQIVDLGGVGFTVRVNGQERQIPTNDVAVIDFTGAAMSDADWQKVTGGSHVVWLKSGEVISGQLYDIGGTSPLNITFRTAGGERQISSSDIGRIVLARTNSSVATTGEQPSTTAATATAGGGIAVPANQAWTSTGLVVRRGEVVTFNTTGEIRLSGDTNDVAGAAGSRAQRMAAAGAPLPNAYSGALVGRVGNGQVFAIGDQRQVRMPDSGQLFLGINDDHVGDNTGEFRVDIQRGRIRR